MIFMEIGISTASFFSKETTEASFEILHRLDIPVCEIFLSTFSEYADDFIDLILQVKGDIRIHSVHTLNQQYEPELFNPTERTRKDCEKIYKHVGYDAHRLGASYYTFHGPAKFKKLPYTHDYEKIGKRVQELCVLLDEASKGTTKLTYENVHWTFFNTPEYFENLKKYTDVLTCLDIKQAFLSGFDIYDYVECMGDRLKTVHICDYDENGRLVMPGKGIFDFTKLFSVLIGNGFDGAGLIEVYSNNYDSYDELAKSYDYLNECLYKAKNNGGI